MSPALLSLVLGLGVGPARAMPVTSRWWYEQAYDNVAGGDWYRDADNTTATLAWGESYVMMSLVSMFRATGDPSYLERLAWHADGVLQTRDDARGVADYRGVSTACWQNTSYQDGGQAYCYVVHTGMITYPMVEFARLVDAAGLGAETAYDGTSFADKAATYVSAAEAGVAAHADQWDEAGFYRFRSDASFLAYPGRDLPLNQSNALGRVHLALAARTGDATHAARGAALCTRLRSQMSPDAGGALVWNYWGGAYSPYGEDVSHAALNVDLAALCAAAGVGFDADDLAMLGDTFVQNVVVDDQTSADRVGGPGGGTNTAGYRGQLGRWLHATSARPGAWAATRELFATSWDLDSIASGSLLAGLGNLAETAPSACLHEFYHVDWADPDEAGDADWRTATAYGANLLTTPPDFDQPCVMPVEVNVQRRVQVQQWDGSAYHTVATWQPTGGATTRVVPYDPRWPYPYSAGRVLWQFADDFAAAEAITVRERPAPVLPGIEGDPPLAAESGVPWSWSPGATGDGPLWWSLVRSPTGARIDPATGLLTWDPGPDPAVDFVVRLESDWGEDRRAFTVEVQQGVSDTGLDTGTPTGDDTGGDTGADTGGSRRGGDDGAADRGGPGTGDLPPLGPCGCGGGGAPPALGGLVLALAAASRRRRRLPG